MPPRHIPWTEAELDDLRALAAAAEGTDEREVSRAVRSLREMANLRSPGLRSWLRRALAAERDNWNENWRTARTTLGALLGNRAEGAATAAVSVATGRC